MSAYLFHPVEKVSDLPFSVAFLRCPLVKETDLRLTATF
ncbi:hypothetical protein LEP1GSC017_2465 [Leptospira meyeri serovar Hardjo str. Went 5]|nr:hypothetical protein LEP1GSC017_2465 [Leptospira meyeri serovar Hardjo str. Went 5]